MANSPVYFVGKVVLLQQQKFARMVYQSRKRKYTSRKEKLERSNRFLRIAAVFVLVVAALLFFFRRQLLIDWVKTFFY